MPSLCSALRRIRSSVSATPSRFGFPRFFFGLAALVGGGGDVDSSSMMGSSSEPSCTSTSSMKAML